MKVFRILFINNFQIIIFILLLLLLFSVNGDNRIKRFIPFPQFAPTRIQFICGMGLPVDLELESVTIGYVFKALYTLPDNMTYLEDFIADPFSPITRPLNGAGRRRRRRRELLSNMKGNEYDKIISEKSEKYETEAIEVDVNVNDDNGTYLLTELNNTDINNANNINDDNNNHIVNEQLSLWNQDETEFYPDDRKQNFGTSRWSLYKGIAKIIELEGLQGRPCVLRSICEAAQVQFTYFSGMLGELMHIIMTPTTTKDKLYQHSDNEYFKAEEFGRLGEPCDKIFNECTHSILDQFSGAYNPILQKIVKIFG